MEYISTRNNKKTFTFKDVFLKGLAPDGGLFIPKKIKKYSKNELKEMAKLNYIDLATKIASKFWLTIPITANQNKIWTFSGLDSLHAESVKILTPESIGIYRDCA